MLLYCWTAIALNNLFYMRLKVMLNDSNINYELNIFKDNLEIKFITT